MSLIFNMLVTGCKQEHTLTPATTPPLSAVTVSVVKVSRQTASNQIEVVGTVQAVDQAEISAKVTGNITTLPVDVGSRVKTGDLLVEIRADEISARLQQAKAHLEQAKRNLAREEKLLRKNAATPESVKALKDTLLIARAGHREAQTILDYTRITAPFSGLVTRKMANTGDLATPGKVLLHLERENKLQILTDVPEAMIHKIIKGDKLPAYIPSVGIQVFGEVTELSPTADPSSRTSPIKLRINSGNNIRSGQFARVTLPLDQSETFAIPSSAVVPYGQMERVFVEKGGKAFLRLVRTGSIISVNDKQEYIEILSGLAEGENVVIQGNQSLENGQSLIIR